MFTDERVKSGLRAWYMLCPLRHTLIIVSAALILLHLLTRPVRALNVWLSTHMVRPAHEWLSGRCAGVRFSAAELFWALLVLFLLGYLIWQIRALFQKPKILLRLYRTLTTLLALGLSFYALFCLLWGVYYYGDDFIAQSGLKQEPVSVEQLERVTEYFAALANTYSSRVERDEEGCYCADREALLERSPDLYHVTQQRYPCLAGPERRVKGVFCSRVMSYLDFTGFFFPFTGEANVNMDFPVALFPATIAHELAHQRGVAKEQEANFVAVLACLDSGDPDYVYSAALLAYTHLGNALYSADREAWARVYGTLNEAVRADFAKDRAYWAQFETPVQNVSNTVYEGFLQSYSQSLGLKSYGACVDLLVNYYDPLLNRETDKSEETEKNP
ncbi:MAG: DUF3810 domain-containing protein [Oscillospiraceae bacterium]|nr:DUF3810 domain-containing protein [Oscillospiraceae bacterium]